MTAPRLRTNDFQRIPLIDNTRRSRDRIRRQRRTSYRTGTEPSIAAAIGSATTKDLLRLRDVNGIHEYRPGERADSRACVLAGASADLLGPLPVWLYAPRVALLYILTSYLPPQ